ncbi:MAG: SprT-like domain-containing protein [Gemmatimonadaceae bacterium]|nr:SprT-like domain-containing protein [Gemmatimonadaceae bacterium]
MTAAVQLGLELPAGGEDLPSRLYALGLDPNVRVALTDNSATMVSFGEGWLRVHRGYAFAGDEVVGAIVRFSKARRRDSRSEAKRVLLGYASVLPGRRARLRREVTDPEDAPSAARLTEAHAELNAQFFGSALKPMDIRVSRRMKRKLGHYALASGDGRATIAISRRHIRRDAWEDVVHTLLHEMVHQWQQENGLPVAHDRAFRAKAREVGIDPRAVRREC